MIPPESDRKRLFEEVHGGVLCARRQVGQRIRPPLTPIPVAGPFDRVGVDVLHFPKSAAGNQYAVVFVDYLTKWPEVFATSDQTALTIAKLLVEEVVSRHGVPAELLSDRGKSFLSLLMQEVCRVLGVKKVQGFAESLQHDSSNQSEIVMIKLYCCGPDYCSIHPLLYYFFQIRNGLGSSVFKLCCKDSAKPPPTIPRQMVWHSN